MDGAHLETAEQDPLEGRLLAGRYEIEVCVGEGAMGRVYRARHRHLGRSFALKVLFGEIAADAAMRHRFAREAEVASRLDHPHVVPSLDFGEIEGGLLFLAMPYVAGTDLATLVRRGGAMAPRRAARIARQVAAGLGHAHARGLIHRDLKPTNILIEPTSAGEHARILDFGLALGSDDEARCRLTTAGIVMGTPLYMAPEQACGGEVDARADLFSLGVTLYEMLAGVPPFEGSPTAVARKHAAAAPPAIADRVPGSLVPPAIEAIAFRLMEKSPGDRYPSADAVVDALGAIRGDALRAQSETPAPVTASGSLDAAATLVLRPPRIGRRGAIAALASVGAAVSLTVALLMVHASRNEDGAGDLAASAAPAPQPALVGSDLGLEQEREDLAAQRATGAELAEFARRYLELGAALWQLEQGDRDTATELRTRFFAIPFGEAIREPQTREDALSALSELAEQIEVTREQEDTIGSLSLP